MKLYPWLEPYWIFLSKAREQKRLSHAYLFCGKKGLGIEQLVEKFHAALLCEKSEREACGACKACLLVKYETHPDKLVLGDYRIKKTISVDEARQLTLFFSSKPLISSSKVASIYTEPGGFNDNSANAILKVLEEPPSGAVVSIYTENPGFLPSTILSRCQKLRVNSPNWGFIEDYLNNDNEQKLSAIDRTSIMFDFPFGNHAIENSLSSNSILKVLVRLWQQKIDVVSAAEKINNLEIVEFIENLEKITEIVAQKKLNLSTSISYFVPHEKIIIFKEISDTISIQNIMSFHQFVLHVKRLVVKNSGIKLGDISEKILAKWQLMFSETL